MTEENIIFITGVLFGLALAIWFINIKFWFEQYIKRIARESEYNDYTKLIRGRR